MLRKLLDTLKVGLNDAQTFGLMRISEQGCVLHEQYVLLDDTIYPHGICIMTPYIATQLTRIENRVKRKCEKSKYYYDIRYYRIGVKHAFAELKQYKITSSVWRHPRPLLSQLETICAGFVCPKKLDGWHL